MSQSSPPQDIPKDVLHTVWVINLSENTTKNHLIHVFEPIAPVKDVFVTQIKGKYVALLEFQSLEGKRLVFRKASEGATFELGDGSQAVVRDSRMSIKLFLEAQEQEAQQQAVTKVEKLPQQQQQNESALPRHKQEEEVELVDMEPNERKPQGNPRFREELVTQPNQKPASPNDHPDALRDKIKKSLDTRSIRQDMPQDTMTQNQLNLIQSGKAQQGSVKEIKKCQASNIDSLTPFEDHQVTQLKEKVSNTIFSSDKLRLVSETAAGHSFSCQQVKDILSAFRISFEQKQLLTEFFFRHIRDQSNIDLVLESFEFSMDREITKKMLAMMAETST
eukprot:CAMPEP_0117456310 /NCGR_PEP_ID=MMETSP0759-20121206/11810_1 /TAXON_ID=63605 /ORGANISM="Percolomonas cosmopolitus, Strain WS" /LENGTH=333 /DNA_ID=CAMNT_0005249643 /DNA_START=8 /DNA_END=1009 /DNA_ORIENTATION=+